MSSDASDPQSLSTGGSLPSSFDDTDFFSESRSQKLIRKVRQEPLIPLGCLATCYALYQASKSIRQGNPVQTNRMFRARIYAQGFTLVAIVAGSIFYKDERMKRKAMEGKVEEKKGLEKREKWLRELEARDKEDREWREKIEKQGLKDVAIPNSPYPSKSVVEDVRRVGGSELISRAREAWRRTSR